MTDLPDNPAKFNRKVLKVIDELLGPVPQGGGQAILDPFAGTGRIHSLHKPGRAIIGIEIEEEWANYHPFTYVGDALDLPFWDNFFDAIATSPTYGNRMADHHDAKDGSTRNTYKHKLGRDLHPNNSGQLQWGPKYRDFHRKAWAETDRVLKPGGSFILNISDHIRAGKRMHVTSWHMKILINLFGYEFLESRRVKTPRNRFGANADLRVDYESVILFRKPSSAETDDSV